MDKTPQEHVEELQLELAHMTRQYEQLSQVVFERGKTVDSLQRLVQKLFKKVEKLESAAGGGGGSGSDFSGGEPTEGFEFGLDGEPRT